MQFQGIINNNQAVVRNEQMEGRDYLVVPMIMLVEGVHNGSNGPLYYSEAEIQKSVPLWNQRPVVVYHPEDKDGNGTYASVTPDIVTEYKVGVIMNTVFEDGKLKAEAWLEESRLNEVGPSVLLSIQNNNMLEVSTGLLTDNIVETGTWNDETYTAITTNYRPDHLAILPDQKGACSIEDGAGLLRNKETGNKKGVLMNVVKRIMSAIKPIENEASHNDVRSQLTSIVNATETEWVWVEDIFDDYFIFEKDGQLYKQNYYKTNDIVSVEGVAEKVIRETSYKTVTGAPISNQTKHEGNNMNKTQMVAGLISNGAYTEDDRDMLEALEDGALARIYEVTTNTETPPAVVPVVDAPVVDTPVVDTPVANTELTTDEYIAQAPPAMQAVLRAGLTANAQLKTTLIAGIVANTNNTFTKEQLEGKDPAELQMISNLMGTAVPASILPLFAASAGEPIQNHEGDDVEAPMTMPVMNFETTTV